MSHLYKPVRLLLACLIFAALTFFSIQPSHASAEGTAYIRIIHASPDIGTVDVFVDGNRLLSSFQFGVVTPYVPLPAGGHNVQLALIGTGVGAAVITQSISVSPGAAYTVAALGTNAIGFSLTVFQDNNLVSGNDAKIRVYHLSPGTGGLTLTNGSSTVVQDLSYQQASNYIDIPAGSYTLDASVPSDNTIPISTTLKPWTITSVFAVGVLNGKPAIQFVSTQVQGLPGMPGTGSDPNAIPENSHPLPPWVFTPFLLLTLVGAGFATRRLRTHTRV